VTSLYVCPKVDSSRVEEFLESFPKDSVLRFFRTFMSKYTLAISFLAEDPDEPPKIS